MELFYSHYPVDAASDIPLAARDPAAMPPAPKPATLTAAGTATTAAPPAATGAPTLHSQESVNEHASSQLPFRPSFFTKELVKESSSRDGSFTPSFCSQKPMKEFPSVNCFLSPSFYNHEPRKRRICSIKQCLIVCLLFLFHAVCYSVTSILCNHESFFNFLPWIEVLILRFLVSTA